MKRHHALRITIAVGLSFAATGAKANLLTNGDFETGMYSGWTTSVQTGSDGNLNVVPSNGGTSPLSGSIIKSSA